MACRDSDALPLWLLDPMARRDGDALPLWLLDPMARWDSDALPHLAAGKRITTHSIKMKIPPLNTIPFRGPKVRSNRAFTLVEMLLVLMILGVLAAIVVPKMAN